MNSIRNRSRIPEAHEIPATALPQLLTVAEAARYLGISKSCLDKARCEGLYGQRTPMPKFVRVGGRVLYRRSDLEMWVTGLPSYNNLAEMGGGER
jgi:predicted DNA-binding transcriptional regulator AlpA